MNEMTIGERIKAKREELGLSQLELAELSGYKSKTTISKLESGQRLPKQSQIKAISAALHVRPSWLMGWGEDEEETSYYTEAETASLAQQMYDDPDMRVLYEMKRHMSPEVFKLHVEHMRQLYAAEHPEDDDIYGA